MQLGRAVSVAAGALLCAAALHAQTSSERQKPTVPAEIAVHVAGKAYAYQGNAECSSSSTASIYDIPAVLYSVAHLRDKDSLRLTLWQPKNGTPNMMTLAIELGGKDYLVDTVKAAAKPQTKGSGQTKLEKSASGATFTIIATTAQGEKIEGTIKCTRFTEIEAEGG